MTSEINLGKLFQEWQELNNKVGESFGNFDFATIKEFRSKQRKIEDTVYTVLLEKAPDNIKKFLPEEGCGEMEIGYNVDDNIFYFLMYNPEDENDDSVYAVTIGADEKIELIKDFKHDDE